MKKLIAPLLLAITLAGGWYLASPWLAMKGVADAARARDVATLEERVDFAAVKLSAQREITRQVRAQQGRGGLIDAIGGVAAERVAREIVERTVDAENIGALVATGALAAPLIPERLRSQRIDWDVEREGLNRFRGIGTFEDGTPGPILIFERDGLGWVMTGFALP